MILASVLYGTFAVGFLIAGFFFYRFWRGERQPLLIFIALAFVLLAVNYGLLGAMQVDERDDSWIYLFRLAAFILIIVGIVVTNIGRPNANGS